MPQTDTDQMKQEKKLKDLKKQNVKIAYILIKIVNKVILKEVRVQLIQRAIVVFLRKVKMITMNY